MDEQQAQTPGGSGDDSNDAVLVSYGIAEAYIKPGGTVDDALKALRGELNLPTGVLATIKGKTVQGSHKIQAGEQLVLIRPAGEKG